MWYYVSFLWSRQEIGMGGRELLPQSALTYMTLHPFTELGVNTDNFHLLVDSQLFSTIKASTCSMWMKPGKSGFARKKKQWRDFPQDALLQHAWRTAYQRRIWFTSEQTEQCAPGPEGWGWTRVENSQSWIHVWCILFMTAKAWN